MRRRWQTWDHRQIIDILPTRKYPEVAGRIDAPPRIWKERIRFGALDMSNVYAAVYTVVLPKAAQVVDPFDLTELANRSLDAVRRPLAASSVCTSRPEGCLPATDPRRTSEAG